MDRRTVDDMVIIQNQDCVRRQGAQYIQNPRQQRIDRGRRGELERWQGVCGETGQERV
jgi:hypothetical protein